jgi:hypothetical protein
VISKARARVRFSPLAPIVKTQVKGRAPRGTVVLSSPMHEPRAVDPSVPRSAGDACTGVLAVSDGRDTVH